MRFTQIIKKTLYIRILLILQKVFLLVLFKLFININNLGVKRILLCLNNINLI